MSRRWFGGVAEVLKAQTGLADPVQAMQQLAADLIDEAELDGPPVDLLRVGSHQGVVDIRAVPMHAAARLIPQGRNLVIEVNAAHHLAKQRFSAAHDITHTLLPTYRRTYLEDPDTGRFGESEEERLCDYGAAALLLDPRWIVPRLAESPPCLQVFIDLATDFGASLHATAIQIAAAGVWNAAFVFWEEGFRKADRSTVGAPLLPEFDALGPPSPKWRVAARYPQEIGGCYIPHNKSVESTSLVAQCCTEAGATWGVELFQFGRSPVRLACENVYLPYRAGDEMRPRIISLLQPTAKTAPPALSVQRELLW